MEPTDAPGHVDVQVPGLDLLAHENVFRDVLDADQFPGQVEGTQDVGDHADMRMLPSGQEAGPKEEAGLGDRVDHADRSTTSSLPSRAWEHCIAPSNP